MNPILIYSDKHVILVRWTFGRLAHNLCAAGRPFQAG